MTAVAEGDDADETAQRRQEQAEHRKVALQFLQTPLALDMSRLLRVALTPQVAQVILL